ncbi:MAG: peptidoglycan-binding protein [Clostridia bacterium]|nr:peptidoglycan-binding protein [Clostridia bacterium]
MPTSPFEKEAITNLQRYLYQLSFTDPNIPPVPVDGVYGNNTKKAVRAFQQSRGLTSTGQVDQETWDLIYLAYLESLESTGRTEPLYLFPRNPEAYSVGLGDEGLIISAIRYLLRELMIDYGGEFEDIPLAGTFDTVTEGAVKQFQQLFGLPITGRVDRVTWNRLVTAQRPEAIGYRDE